MTIEDFKSDENIGILWEIILDVNNGKSQNVDNIKLDFLFKIGKFVEIMIAQKNEKMDCLSLNKVFITNYVGSIEGQNGPTRSNTIQQVPTKQFPKNQPEPELIFEVPYVSKINGLPEFTLDFDSLSKFCGN